MTTTKRAIKLTVESIDGFRETRSFKTLKGAQAFAHKYVGATPEISVSFGYAVSGYGTTKVIIQEGCTFKELFPAAMAGEEVPEDDGDPSRLY